MSGCGICEWGAAERKAAEDKTAKESALKKEKWWTAGKGNLQPAELCLKIYNALN